LCWYQDGLNIPKAIVIGHDWGGFIAWRMCLYHPGRVLAVCAICTPFNPPRPEYISLDKLVQIYPNFAYQKLLADSEKTAARLDTQPERFFSAIFRRYNEYKPYHLIALLNDVTDLSIDAIFTNPSTLLSDAERKYYVDQYTKRGFLGGCNYYRVTKVNHETEKADELPRTISQPALFIGAEKDIVLSPVLAKSMSKYISKLKSVVVKKAGHWILWEQPEEVNHHLLEWLEELEHNKIITSSCSTLHSHL
jgi:soluble epoxide hydrolase/lipid-phosphate phosphatase